MLPTDDARRKKVRAFMGFVKYFPDAVALTAYLSKMANEQHNPGQPMHWAKDKSTEELDSLMNHLIDIGAKGELSKDSDNILDAIKVAWRGMANLQRLADKYGTDFLFDLMETPAEATQPTIVVQDTPSKLLPAFSHCVTEGCVTYVEKPRVRCSQCIYERDHNRSL